MMSVTFNVRRYWCLKLILFLINLSYNSLCRASLPGETLLNLTSCSAGNIVINCGSEIIGLEKIELAFVGGTCTGNYDSTDCIINTSDSERQFALRECSGKSTCSVDLSGLHDFCTSGFQPVTYVHVQYYCIDGSRTKSICSTGTITSSSAPLYLTNTNYPSKTSGSESCSCSIEVQSCSSNTNLYTLDLDLYNDVSDCRQSIAITDDTNTNLKTLECENFYAETSLTTDTLNSNFITMTFTTPAVNIDGYFFIAYAATEAGATVNVTCQAQAETWCIDCGSPPVLTDGSYSASGATSYNSTADVQCNQGYDASAGTISCMEQGNWGSATCTIKDCGSPPALNDGSYSTSGATTYGSTADVHCNQGYDASAATISCSDQGTWESATCIKDCGSVPNIDHGDIELVNTGVTTYGALANVLCDTNYIASTNQISCLASGSWEAATCRRDDAKDSPPADGESDNSVVLAVVISITLVELVQMVAIILFHFIIYNNRTTEGHTYAWMLYPGHIPVIGIVFVALAIYKTKIFSADTTRICEVTKRNRFLYVASGFPFLGIIALACIHPCGNNANTVSVDQNESAVKNITEKSLHENEKDAEKSTISANTATVNGRAEDETMRYVGNKKHSLVPLVEYNNKNENIGTTLTKNPLPSIKKMYDDDDDNLL